MYGLPYYHRYGICYCYSLGPFWSKTIISCTIERHLIYMLKSISVVFSDVSENHV